MIDGFVDWRIRFIDLLINWLIGSSLHGSWTIWNWFQNDWLIYIFINIYRFPPYVIDWLIFSDFHCVWDLLQCLHWLHWRIWLIDWYIDILIDLYIYIFRVPTHVGSGQRRFITEQTYSPSWRDKTSQT